MATSVLKARISLSSEEATLVPIVLGRLCDTVPKPLSTSSCCPGPLYLAEGTTLGHNGPGRIESHSHFMEMLNRSSEYSVQIMDIPRLQHTSEMTRGSTQSPRRTLLSMKITI